MANSWGLLQLFSGSTHRNAQNNLSDCSRVTVYSESNAPSVQERCRVPVIFARQGAHSRVQDMPTPKQNLYSATPCQNLQQLDGPVTFCKDY